MVVRSVIQYTVPLIAFLAFLNFAIGYYSIMVSSETLFVLYLSKLNFFKFMNCKNYQIFPDIWEAYLQCFSTGNQRTAQTKYRKIFSLMGQSTEIFDPWFFFHESIPL
jgi:hypothetical protein